MKVKIGEVLVSQGLVTPEQVDKALTFQKKQGGKLGSIMVELGFVSDQALATALSKQLHLPAAQAEDFQKISETALKKMDAQTVKKHGCLPLIMRERLRIAISDPWEIKAINEWAVRESIQIQLVIAPEIWITAAMERHYKIPRPNRFREAAPANAPLAEESEEIIELDEKAIIEDLSFPHFQQTLSDCRSIEEVFDALLSFLSPLLPQIAVFVARKGIFSGWVLHGFPARANAFSQIQIHATQESPLKQVVESKQTHKGPITAEVAKLLGFELLQVPYGQRVQFFPILFRGKVSTVLMGVPAEATENLPPEQERQIRQACEKTEAALEMLVYRRLILAPTTV